MRSAAKPRWICGLVLFGQSIALTIKPDPTIDPVLYLHRANDANQRGELDEAIANLEAAAHLRPDSPVRTARMHVTVSMLSLGRDLWQVPWNNMANMLLGAEQTEKAYKAVKKAQKLGEMAMTYDTLAHVLRRQRKEDEAETSFLRALKAAQPSPADCPRVSRIRPFALAAAARLRRIVHAARCPRRYLCAVRCVLAHARMCH
jgi:tetratricopeptide (TPR) repeat protein